MMLSPFSQAVSTRARTDCVNVTCGADNYTVRIATKDTVLEVKKLIVDQCLTNSPQSVAVFLQSGFTAKDQIIKKITLYTLGEEMPDDDTVDIWNVTSQSTIVMVCSFQISRIPLRQNTMAECVRIAPDTLATVDKRVFEQDAAICSLISLEEKYGVQLINIMRVQTQKVRRGLPVDPARLNFALPRGAVANIELSEYFETILTPELRVIVASNAKKAVLEQRQSNSNIPYVAAHLALGECQEGTCINVTARISYNLADTRSYFCPLGKSIIEEAVTASDGITYDKKHIEAWIAVSRLSNEPLASPVTSQPILATLTPNVELQTAIDRYKAGTCCQAPAIPSTSTGACPSLPVVAAPRTGEQVTMKCYTMLEAHSRSFINFLRQNQITHTITRVASGYLSIHITCPRGEKLQSLNREVTRINHETRFTGNSPAFFNQAGKIIHDSNDEDLIIRFTSMPGWQNTNQLIEGFLQEYRSFNNKDLALPGTLRMVQTGNQYECDLVIPQGACFTTDVQAVQNIAEMYLGKVIPSTSASTELRTHY